MLIWRGGKPFEAATTNPAKKQAPPKTNGTGSDVIDLDSDNDDVPTQIHVDEAVFEEVESEHDPSQPYEPIIQTLELPLGTGVLHLSFPHLGPDLHSGNLGLLPKLFSQKLLLAVACTDCSLRVLTVPLSPPSPESKRRPELMKNLLGASVGNGVWGEQMLSISGLIGHKSIPRGVSVTLTSQSTVGTNALEVDDPELSDSVSFLGSSFTHERKPTDRVAWDILVASHSSDVSGLLLIHRIALLRDGSGMNLNDFKTNAPWRSHYLASPPLSIQFNTSLYPAARHSHLLLTDRNGVVRIYDCQSSKTRRGLWPITLDSNNAFCERGILERKNILAAQWILGGKAIAVLLNDGEWGVWDLEEKGPTREQDSNPSPTPAGVDLSRFAISGRVDAAENSSETLASTETATVLVPMTPGTRKLRQEKLFKDPGSKVTGPVRGGVSILSAPQGHGHRADDESLLLWHRDNVQIFPSLFTYWQTLVKGSTDVLSHHKRGQIVNFDGVHLGGELRTGASLMPRRFTTSTGRNRAADYSVLITGEHRFVVVSLTTNEPPASASKKLRVRSGAIDQALLAQSELDVDGINNAILEMERC